MRTVGLLLAIAAVAPQEPASVTPATSEAAPVRVTGERPQLQARLIRPGKGGLARGVTLYVPRDGEGNRYYYSRSLSPGMKSRSESTIESWSDSQGRPLRATYRLESTTMSLRIDLTIRKGEIVFDERVAKPGAKPATAHVVVPVPPDTVLQLSQFHPMDVRLDPNGVAEFTIVDPVAKTATPARMVRSSVDLAPVGPNVAQKVLRYRIETGSGWSEIELEENGRFRQMKDSEGTLMTAVDATPAEVYELRATLNRVVARSSAAE
jgi:hypothetical protein